MAILLRRGIVPPVSTGPLLDTLSGSAAIAMSSRKLRSAYVGNAMKVRRSSDNATQNIGFNGNGDLDTSALSSFVGANSAFVDTWYDQSGNGRDLTQATQANQPRVVNAGANDVRNGHVAIFYIAASSTQLIFPSALVLSQPTSYAVCIQHTVAAPATAHFLDSAGSGRNLMTGASGTWQMYAGAGIVGTASDTSIHQFVGIFNGASSSGIIDGLTNMSGDVSTQNGGDGASPEKIGQSGSAAIDGYIPEIIVMSSVMSAGDISTIRTSWQSYWGTP